MPFLMQQIQGGPKMKRLIAILLVLFMVDNSYLLIAIYMIKLSPEQAWQFD